MTLPPDKVGYKGQRFEIRVRDAEYGEESCIGWSNDPFGFHVAILAMPRWKRLPCHIVIIDLRPEEGSVSLNYAKT